MAKIDRTINKVEKLRESLYGALGKATIIAGEAIGDGDEFVRATAENVVAKCIKDAIEGCRSLNKHLTTPAST